MRVEDWVLTRAERGNAATDLPPWSDDNLVSVHVHGAAYFDRLVNVVEAMASGDLLLFTDWRGDPDQLLRPDGPTVAELLSAAARRGVQVKGLVWRSHLDTLVRTARENRNLAENLDHDGGQVRLDQRVRYFGSHHQKFGVARHPERPERDVAFAGGIDLCHSRRDDADHTGDPQPISMSGVYGNRPPWHDVQLELRGPVVAALEHTFRERWDDPAPLRAGNPVAMLRDRLAGRPVRPGPLPPRTPIPGPRGPHQVQLMRTYPAKVRPYPFAPSGERSIARGYVKAIRRARRLIYLEDQYMWSTEVADLFAAALRENPALHLVVVVPRHPDVDGGLALPPNQIGRQRALDVCRRVDPSRVHVYDLENHAGTPVYVHAKVCVVDDVWASVGSDNFNRRSWSHDSELSCAVLDPTPDPRPPHDPGGLGDCARVFARDLRLTLMREHLDRAPGDDGDLLDPADAVHALTTAAAALDAWHDGGRRGTRPPGRLRRHDPRRLSAFTRAWATAPYLLIYDPDGRPRRLRRQRKW
ncbi:phospholipase D family protein [Pseudosporangium ferrugineum]|uniref:Phosphatidylserine/phosphatidylglycerophosphate/ cardiolipin synthase-like enzyme n=1 Tax=Pseudosporangium ferrugineum TaxID=439699 RepID=A0A2T0RG70_9ACTN|nr:phospholipase D family protein [Pseudosporangium ferrugineum]PRY20121.1 phosphatidylserine/phosphatidylglycerophosphate/cardiolipin synthase-like enzyme [Pseudosporangium ferrugineum]